MIRAVLFDFYDSLGYMEPEPILEARRAMAARAGADQGRFFEAWRGIFRARTLGELGPLEQEIAHAFGLLGLHLPAAEVHALAAHERAAWCDSVRLYGDTLPTLVRLREAGLKLALVSNCSCQAADAIRATGIADELDALIVSCEVGAMKPDPAIYLRACEALGVAPAACAFVGDGGSRELAGAQALGMLTVRIERENHRGNHAEDQPYQHHLTALDGLLGVVREAA